MCHVAASFSYTKLRFHTIRNAPRGSHCSGMEECRLRDPPQAENPASQDSFLSYRKLCFHTIINAPRGCALGARVDGCRGNRASARECAKAHSFLCYRAGQSVMVSAGETFIGRCQSDKDGIFQTGMVYSTQQNKVRNRTGGVKISRDHNRAGILEFCIK